MSFLKRYLVIFPILFTVQANAVELVVSEAYIRGLPSGQTVTAAFMTIYNGYGHDCRLLGVASPIASRAELHQHRHRDGVMSMRRVPELTIPAGGQVDLRPGGYHLMLFGLQAKLLDGEEYPVSLLFEACPDVELSVPVRDVLREGISR
ncbi:copper chaperone PCu(A)C [Porticoccus sp.]|uniref:copper chaperone PCu(A)C n=1 Tax=Porticoccus sp. TaxID=2024853 RepID=UPI003F69E239